MKGKFLLGMLPALAFVACSNDVTMPATPDVGVSAAFDLLSGNITEEFSVCKTYSGTVGPAVTIDWSAQRESGAPGSSGSVVLADGECTVVYRYINDANSNTGLEKQRVTVTERPVFGYTTSYIMTSQASIRSPIVVGPETVGNSTYGDMTSNPDNGFSVEFINTEIPSADGFMTGGGSVFTAGGIRVTHGFELHCDLSDPNRLEVNWEGNRFHMTELSSALCTDDPAYDEGQPKAGFDTFDGSGVGRYNGVDGYGIRFQFIDDGQPGTGDIARIEITNGATVVMSVDNFLVKGNHQAHK